MRDSIQLSYHYAFVDCPITRIRQCDRICYFGWKHDVPDFVWQNLKQGADVCGIGTKNHGTSNGIFYKYRHRSDYYFQRTALREDFHIVNRLLKDEWRGNYMNLLSLTIDSKELVPVFTPNHKFITYDGRHLTPSGARFYAYKLSGSLWQ